MNPNADNLFKSIVDSKLASFSSFKTSKNHLKKNNNTGDRNNKSAVNLIGFSNVLKKKKKHIMANKNTKPVHKNVPLMPNILLMV